MLDHSQEIIKNQKHRIHKCCNYKIPDAENIEIRRDKDRKTAGFGGLMKCGDVWSCPVCSKKISEGRRVELSSAVKEAKQRGWRVPMLTLTHSHELSDSLKASKAEMLNAYGRLFSGRWWQEMVDVFGIVGRVRALEITHTKESGWHVHFHILLFSDDTDCDVEMMESFFRSRWKAILKRLGGYARHDIGAVVTERENYIADYIAKFGKMPSESNPKASADNDAGTWTESHELAKQVSKKSRTKDGRTPFQLLFDSMNGDKQSRVLYLDYVAAMKGAQQLVWSNSLKKDLLNEDEKTDDEIAEELDNEVVATVPIGLFRAMSRVGARGHLLDLAANGHDTELMDFITYMKDWSENRLKEKVRKRHANANKHKKRHPKR